MSAVLPVPLPRPQSPADDGPPSDDHGAVAPRRARGTLTVAPAPGRGPVDDRGRAVRVRLVRPVEPPAQSLRADGPAHVRPPVLGSPQALGRPRAAALDAEPESVTRPAEPLPDPTRLCCAVVQAAVEGLRGVRPLAQLVRWVTPEVYDGLALRARLVQEAAVPVPTGRAGIRRVRVCRIGDSAAEATVVVDDGPRVRAVALRVEEHRGRWRAVVLEIG